MTRVGVVGATGYAGAELVRILSGHPDIELSIVTSRQYKDVAFSDIYPAMAGTVDLVCREYSVDSICENTDVVFMALPHKLPMDYVPELIKSGKKIIDLSADFRFKDVSKYESCYQPHTAKKINDQAVYGLSEVYDKEIKKASLVGNPGCYPTSTLLPLVPLLKAGFLDTNTIVVDSKSGVSGAGRALSLATHFCEVNESFKAYKVAAHRHCPEMEEVLSDQAGKPVSITFVPHLVPVTRGMLTTIYATLQKKAVPEDIKKCFQSFYSGRHFVRIRPDGKAPDMLHVKGTNYCDIGFKVDEKNNRLVLMSAIDNLVKGAAGQAVQNMNIMLGFKETQGLDHVPYPL